MPEVGLQMDQKKLDVLRETKADRGRIHFINTASAETTYLSF